MRKCSLCNKKVLRGNGPFFNVPKDERRRKQWNEVCQKELSAVCVLCVDHFLPSDIIKGARRSMLMPSAVPLSYKPKVQEKPIAAKREVPVALKPEKKIIILKPEKKISFQIINTKKRVSSFDINTRKKLSQHGSNTHTACVSMKDSTKKTSMDMETQTDPIVLECTMQIQNEECKRKLKAIQTENKELNRMLLETNNAVNSMRTIFTEGQLRKLMAPQNIQWRWHDISNAIFLHQTGPRAYAHLYKKGYPLPSLSTLQRWCRTFNVEQGFLTTAIDFLKLNTELNSEDKVCSLVFDELKVEDKDKSVQCVQVVMARGLRKSWKQPVYYDYEKNLKKEAISAIIVELERADFPVVALICEMRPCYYKLLKELNVSEERPWFSNPTDAEKKVFALAHVPHLLKEIGNNFLATGLVCNEELLKSNTLKELHKHTTNSERPIKCKLTDEHFATDGKLDVKLAAQLFSKTTANAIRRCKNLGMQLYKPIETADFIQLVNDWFDVYNSSTDTSNQRGKEPFGIALAEQLKTLDRMNKLMSTPMLPNKQSLELFQRGVLMVNKSLPMLFEYMKEHFHVKSIVTQRLSLDVMEDFVSSICIKDVNNPTTKEFKHRLRRYILARNTEHLYGSVDAKTDSVDSVNTSNTSKGIGGNNRKIEEIEDISKEHDDIDLNDLIAIQELSGGMFEYIISRNTENLQSTEKFETNGTKIVLPSRKNVQSHTEVKMELGNDNEELDELGTANLHDWAANFNSSLLEPSAVPGSSINLP